MAIPTEPIGSFLTARQRSERELSEAQEALYETNQRL